MLACLAFGIFGVLKNRGTLTELLYQYGIFSFYWVPAMGFVVLWQLSVEIFPTVAATTGCSITMACGRTGALLAPLIFETLWAAFGRWDTFFHATTAALAVSFGAMTLVRLASNASAQDETELERETPSEVSRLTGTSRAWRRRATGSSLGPCEKGVNGSWPCTPLRW